MSRSAGRPLAILAADDHGHGLGRDKTEKRERCEKFGHNGPPAAPIKENGRLAIGRGRYAAGSVVWQEGQTRPTNCHDSRLTLMIYGWRDLPT